MINDKWVIRLYAATIIVMLLVGAVFSYSCTGNDLIDGIAIGVIATEIVEDMVDHPDTWFGEDEDFTDPSPDYEDQHELFDEELDK